MLVLILSAACANEPAATPALAPTDAAAGEAAEAPPPKTAQAAAISVDELKTRLDAGPLQLIDVRTDSEWGSGHVPGATHGEMGKEDSWTPSLDKEKPVYLICRSGGRSGRVAKLLADQGYQTVNVEGGTSGWVDQGYPVTTP